MTATEQGLQPDYLDIRNAEIDTPDAVYKRFQFLYAAGSGHIIARSGYAILTAEGIVTMTGPHTWRLDAADGPWLIDRAAGCKCSGQPIIPKVRTS